MSYGYSPKKEIPLAVPLVMAGASALTSWLGGSASARANREAQAKLDAEKAKTEAERIRAKFQSWLDTASGQNTLRMLRDDSQRSLRQLQGQAAVIGSSPAEVAAQKELNNQKQAEVIANAVAAHEDKKEAIDASYRQQLSGLTQQQIALDREKGANIAQATSGASNALAQGAVATFGGTKLGQKWMGDGSPGGSGVTPNPEPVSVPSQLQQMGKNYRTLRDLYNSEFGGFT